MQTPAINTDEIRIDIEPLESFDQKLTAVMPAHCIKQITDRLTEGNMEQSDQQLAQLLANICVEESMGRQETPPLWGPALPTKGPPPLPAEGEEFKLTFLLDQMPEFGLPEFSSLTIRKPVREIDAEMVEQEVIAQCLEAGTNTPHDDPLESTDRFTCALTITNPGNDTVEASFPSLTGRLPEPGGQLLLDGISFSGLEAELRGRSKGESITSVRSIPGQILGGSLGDAPYRMELTLTGTERTEPANIDDVANRFGSPSASVLRKQIRTSLENRFEFEQGSFMTEDLFRQLLEAVEDYTPPKRILNTRLQDQARNLAKAIKDNGGSDQDVQAALDKEAPTALKNAVNLLRRRAITAALRSRLKIAVTEQHVQQRIRQLASIHNKRPEDLRKELVDSDMISSVSTQAIEALITQQAIKHATVVEVDADSLEASD